MQILPFILVHFKLIKQWKEGETASKESPHSGKANAQKTLTKTSTKPLQRPMDQEPFSSPEPPPEPCCITLPMFDVCRYDDDTCSRPLQTKCLLPAQFLYQPYPVHQV